MGDSMENNILWTKNVKWFWVKLGRAITIKRAIEKKKPMYKTDTINEAKWLRATTMAIAKLEER